MPFWHRPRDAGDLRSVTASLVDPPKLRRQAAQGPRAGLNGDAGRNGDSRRRRVSPGLGGDECLPASVLGRAFIHLQTLSSSLQLHDEKQGLAKSPKTPRGLAGPSLVCPRDAAEKWMMGGGAGYTMGLGGDLGAGGRPSIPSVQQLQLHSLCPICA
jgi:hypothetical protein